MKLFEFYFFLVTVLILTCLAPSYAQTYRTLDEILITECDIAGQVIAGAQPIELESNLKFKIIRTIGSNHVIRVLEFTGKNTESSNEKLVFNTMAQGAKQVINKSSSKYFLLAVSDMVKTELILEVSNSSGFVFGPLITPIKMRFGSRRGDPETRRSYFDLTADVNLGVAAGHKWARVRQASNRPFEIALLAGVSLTSITMNADNTGGYLTSENKISALTTTGAFVFIKDNFQVGLMGGMDYPSGELGKKWIYRNMPWLGIGLGLTLFQNNNAETKPIALKNKND